MKDKIVTFKLSQDENTKVESLMEILSMKRSELIRYAIKNLYNEIKK